MNGQSFVLMLFLFIISEVNQAILVYIKGLLLYVYNSLYVCYHTYSQGVVCPLYFFI